MNDKTPNLNIRNVQVTNKGEVVLTILTNDGTTTTNRYKTYHEVFDFLSTQSYVISEAHLKMLKSGKGFEGNFKKPETKKQRKQLNRQQAIAASKHYELEDNTTIELFDPKSIEFQNKHPNWKQRIKRTFASQYDSDGNRIFGLTKIGAGFPSASGDLFYLSIELVHVSIDQLCISGRMKLRILNPYLLKHPHQTIHSEQQFSSHKVGNAVIEVIHYKKKPTEICITNKSRSEYLIYFNSVDCAKPHIVTTKERIERPNHFLFIVSKKPDLRIYYDKPNYYVLEEDYNNCNPSPLYSLTQNDSIKEQPLIQNDAMVNILKNRKPSSGFKPVNKNSRTYSQIQTRKTWQNMKIKEIMSATDSPTPNLKPVSPVLKYVLENNGKATIEDIMQNCGIQNVQSLIKQLEELKIKGYRGPDGIIRYGRLS